MKLAVLISSATMTALMAGLFFSWTYAVIPGLARVSDAVYISAMQSINREIQNPVFFLCFFGAALLLPVSTYFYFQPSSPRFWLLLAATVFYLGGVMGVTVLGNVPLNEALDAFDSTTATGQEIARQRNLFEIPWNRLNAIRTAASGLSLILVILACTLAKELSE